MTTVVLVQQGGTGSNNAADARSALGAAPSAAYDQANSAFTLANNALPKSGGTVTGQLNVTGTGLALNVANNVFFGSNVAIGRKVENFPLYVERASLGVTSVFIIEDGVLNPRLVVYGNNQGSVIQHTYSANASNLLFSIGGSIGDGSEAMRITENRNVGIGITNPTSKLHVDGSAIFTQDVTVTGNLFLQGNTTYINVATLNVNDPLIYLASNNSLSDTVDIGIMGAKNTSGTYSHTGLARDATDGKWKLFDGLPEEGHISNVINFANTYLATLVANVEANTLSVVNGISGNVNFDSGTLFVDSVNDRVGIGTNSPSVRLQVEGTTNLGSRAIFAKTSAGTLQFGADRDVSSCPYIGSSSNHAFAIITNDIERMRINTSGNIGIGTTSPGSRLDVRGVITGGDGTIQTVISYLAAAGVTGTLTNHPYVLYANNAERVRIDSTGRVGIGTVSPTTSLDVNGTIALGGFAFASLSGNYFRLQEPSGNVAIYIGNNNDGSNYYDNNQHYFRTRGGSTTRMFIGSDGNVGIGTTSPTEKLEVINGGFGVGNGTIKNILSYTTIGIIGTTSNHALGFYANNSERARIDTSGRLLIGYATNTDGSALQIDSNAVGSTVYSIAINNMNTSTSAYNVVRWQQGASGSAVGYAGTGGSAASNPSFQNSFVIGTQSNSPLVFNTNDGEKMRITSAGNVGIANTAPTAYRLSVTGDIYASNNIIAFSDARSKTNISNIENALAKVEAIRGVTYNKVDNPEARMTGVIAQEVLEVLPEAVMGNNESGYAVAYGNMVGLLIEAIKELKKEVDLLKKS